MARSQYAMVALIKFLREHEPPLGRKLRPIYRRVRQAAAGKEWFSVTMLDYIFGSKELRDEFEQATLTPEYQDEVKTRRMHAGGARRRAGKTRFRSANKKRP